MPGQIKTSQLIPGIVSADTAGRALLAPNVLDNTTCSGVVANGAFPMGKLVSQTHVNVGRGATGHVRWGADSNANDTITVTVGAAPTVFTAKVAPAAPTEFTCGGGAPATATDFANKVMAYYAGAVWTGKHPVDNAVDLHVTAPGVAFALAESSPAGPRVFVQDNADESAPAQRSLWYVQHAVTAEDDLRQRILINTGLTVINGTWFAIKDGAGIYKTTYNGNVLVAGGLIDIGYGGLVDPAAGDLIEILCLGA